MASEIESKYICKRIPEDSSIPELLSQGYIHIDPIKQVRVRIYRKEAWMCIKYMDGNYRDEFEVKMDYSEGLKLFNHCQYKVTKHRYSGYLKDDCHYDIDEYDDGTIIVEVERPTLEYKVELPDWIGECVDGIYRYNNYYFAGYPEEQYK